MAGAFAVIVSRASTAAVGFELVREVDAGIAWKRWRVWVHDGSIVRRRVEAAHVTSIFRDA